MSTRWLPAPIRSAAAGAWREWTRRAVVQELTGIARSGRPVIIGPWLGEVGFELLYWRPFLEWAVDACGFDRARLVVISRGGPAAWYGRVSARYRDAFEFLAPEELAGLSEERIAVFGEQKQVRLTASESALVAAVARAEGLDRPAILHPGLMFRLFNPFWWKHADESWIRSYTRFETLPPATTPAVDLPGRFTAVKFYFNEAFPATVENRAAAERIVRELSEEGPVVSLATGLRVDDHAAWEEEAQAAQRGVQAPVPATNLAQQDAIVARASAWVGTYGGFAYLAPSRGIPARAVYSNPAGFSKTHLALAQSVFKGFGHDLLLVSPAGPAPVAVAS
ncbi:MAG: hypothetical protein ABL971_01305 [Vicinamibacterales bacterium]